MKPEKKFKNVSQLLVEAINEWKIAITAANKDWVDKVIKIDKVYIENCERIKKGGIDVKNNQVAD
ncbi:MAG: hypothetical protein Q8P28_04355 [Deltaproteobacteria bacterium]|nr:hypothetical protein [Deltaproteobacteria bacterium]